MEDGIERNLCYLNKDNNLEDNYLYLYIQTESCSNDLKITFDRPKARKFLKEKTHRIDYKKNEENLYVPSYDCIYTNN